MLITGLVVNRKLFQNIVALNHTLICGEREKFDTNFLIDHEQGIGKK